MSLRLVTVVVNGEPVALRSGGDADANHEVFGGEDDDCADWAKTVQARFKAEVTDVELADFKAKWATEYAEWVAIQAELAVTAEDGVTAYQVSAEQARRMRERGETSVLQGPVAKAMGLSSPVMLYPVPNPPLVGRSNVQQFLAGYSREEIREIRDACDKVLAADPPAGGCFVPGCTGPCEGEPDRAVLDPPVRCRIGWAHGEWQCRSSGCGASGTVDGSRLVDHRGVAISKDDVPAQSHAYDPAETCLFDREKST